MQKHCCERMDFFLEEQKVSISYFPKFREYGIGMKNGTVAIQSINYCPWCGSQLPKNLGDKWFEMLEDDFGIEEPFSDDADKVPAEFKTDEWWKKRGL